MIRTLIVAALLALVVGCVSSTSTPDTDEHESNKVEEKAPSADEVHTQDVYMHEPRGSNNR